MAVHLCGVGRTYRPPVACACACHGASYYGIPIALDPALYAVERTPSPSTSPGAVPDVVGPRLGPDGRPVELGHRARARARASRLAHPLAIRAAALFGRDGAGTAYDALGRVRAQDVPTAGSGQRRATGAKGRSPAHRAQEVP